MFESSYGDSFFCLSGASGNQKAIAFKSQEQKND